MKKILLVIFIAINSSFLFAQITLTIEGTVVNDTTKGTSLGVIIPRSQPTTFTYRNNSITSVNSVGYMLQAGDEVQGSTNNNLKGEIIAGNKFSWIGTDPTGSSEAIFTGYNINVVIKYNYLDKTPMAIPRKSDGMTNTSGGVAYNILISPGVGVVVKGMNDVNIYNNTFYQEKTISETGRALIDIYTNTDHGLSAISTGTKVFNNIFYTKHQTNNIKIYETACLSGFESDYNIFWCEAGEPVFNIAGVTKTFTQWQALGYDTHSVVINPDFINFTDFVPRVRLDYGTNLGNTWEAGLSINAVWGTTIPATTNQNGNWQVGARIYDAITGYDTNPGSGDKEERKIIIYPNPSHDFFNISIEDLTLKPQIIKIIDLYGNIVYTESIEQGIKNVQIQENLKAGIYNITLETGRLILYAQKLVINK